MNKTEVNENRAVEAFLNHENGGLPSSRLTLVFARSGVGKSSFAVNFGLNFALKGKRVLHFSVGMTSEKVHEYYHEVFLDWVRTGNVQEDSWSKIEKKFTVITYLQTDNLLKQMESEINTLVKEGQMHPCLIVVDGIDFHEKSQEKLKLFEEIAEHQGIPVLMTLRIHRNEQGDLQVEEPLKIAQTFTDSIYLLDFDEKNIGISAFEQNAKEPTPLPFFIEPHTMLLSQK